ncbi:MAG: hypothetical protein HGB26_06405, partial [Desulfobulbaceae bacterium]|nr:hypothetical protein [Desulfobulbaceae bacterium]
CWRYGPVSPYNDFASYARPGVRGFLFAQRWALHSGQSQFQVGGYRSTSMSPQKGIQAERVPWNLRAGEAKDSDTAGRKPEALRAGGTENVRAED